MARVGFVGSAVWAALLVAAASPRALGQAKVGLEIDADEAHVNEPFVVTIRVDNFQACDVPVFPQLAGATVRDLPGGGESSQTLIINRQRTESRSRTFLFEVTPQAEGELVIPPVKVTVDGRELQTKPAKVAVRPSDVEKLLWVEISCERSRVYVGQRVRLALAIWVRPARYQDQPLGPSDMSRFFDGRGTSLGPFPSQIRTDVRRLENPGAAAETYYTYSSTADYTPDRPGLLSFDEVVVGMQYPTRFSRDVFGQLEVRSFRNLRARPKVSSVEVLSVPTNGRPANFTGAVGTFGITVSAQPLSVRVGDPIQLTVEIRGDGPIDTLPPPDLAADPRLTQGFRVPREELAGEVSGSRKRFTQTIRAERTDVAEIPSIEYPFFDPDRERYIVALSEPIPIAVLPAAELDTSRLVDSSAAPARPGAAELRALDGLRGNKTRESELLRSTAPIGLGQVALVTFAPPAVSAALWGWAAYVQTRGPARRRRQNALRTARQRIERARSLPPPAEAAEIAAALAGYLADRLDQPAARCAGATGAGFLLARNVARPVYERWCALTNRCERALFGGAADGDADTLATDALESVQALERERL